MYFLHLIPWLTPNKPKTLIFHILYRCLLTVISSFRAISYKYFTNINRNLLFLKMQCSYLSHIGWNFLSVTNERVSIILPPSQEARKTNKATQARQQLKLFFFLESKCLSCCCCCFLSTFKYFVLVFLLPLYNVGPN